MFELRKYPKNWRAISTRILERDGHQCRECKVRNFSVGRREDGGRFLLLYQAESYREGYEIAQSATKGTGRKYTVIVLQCAHLFNDDPMDIREENLGMLCPHHHGKWDGYRHATKNHARRLHNQELRSKLGRRPRGGSRRKASKRKHEQVNYAEEDFFLDL